MCKLRTDYARRALHSQIYVLGPVLFVRRPHNYIECTHVASVII